VIHALIVSEETTGISGDGRTKHLPIEIFDPIDKGCSGFGQSHHDIADRRRRSKITGNDLFKPASKASNGFTEQDAEGAQRV
jgi:hypothetical protein